MPEASASIEVRPLAGAIGAELANVDLSGATSDETVAGIRRALLANKVVFLRDQQLDLDRQVAFARRLGTVTAGHPIYASPTGQPFLREMDSRQGSRANHWHTDLTFIRRPPAFALLHAKVIPPVGGDTMWANMATAYAELPAELRRLADTLRVVHSNDSDYTDATVGARREYIATPYESEHPLVRVHPETGERALVLGGFARRVVGLGPSASRDLLRVFQEHAVRPEHTVRWRWRVGDLAIWDNQATQHYAIYDYGDQVRRAERVTVAGPVPVGVDGRESVALLGDTEAYSRDAPAGAEQLSAAAR
ncbi:TauD/TfdA dioxygenase family protein [Micromonospora sp. NPDC018662]|uniref:TauD/TfdA dioxygenase family protein n=1 Tax=Micromonospora sp. NPDC018662 TaxID=3364238 RepID=UPI0037979A72